MAKKRDKSEWVVRSVRFDKQTFTQLTMAAEKAKLSFGTYVKSAALNYAAATIMDEQLEPAEWVKLDEGDPAQNLMAMLSEIKESLAKPAPEQGDAVMKRFDRMEELFRLMLYVQFYYAREIPQEHKGTMQLRAKRELGDLLKKFDSGDFGVEAAGNPRK